jgi:hypothetical protein
LIVRGRWTKGATVLQLSLYAGKWVADHGIEGNGEYAAASLPSWLAGCTLSLDR